MPSFNAWDGSSWRTGQAVSVWDGAVWRTAVGVWVWDGALWRKVFPGILLLDTPSVHGTWNTSLLQVDLTITPGANNPVGTIYHVERSNTSTGTFAEVSSGTSTSQADASVSQTTTTQTKWYRVWAAHSPDTSSGRSAATSVSIPPGAA